MVPIDSYDKYASVTPPVGGVLGLTAFAILFESITREVPGPHTVAMITAYTLLLYGVLWWFDRAYGFLKQYEISRKQGDTSSA